MIVGRWLVVLMLAGCAGGVAYAQPVPGTALPAPGTVLNDAGAVRIPSEASGETAALTFFNRPIAVLRARVLGNGPAQRAAGAARILDELVSQGIDGPVESRPIDGGILVLVGPRVVFGLAPPDVDDLSGETLEGNVSQAVGRLRQALAEAHEARAPGRLLQSVALSVIVLAAGVLLLWAIGRSRRAATGRLMELSAKTVARTGVASAEAVRASRVIQMERRLVNGIALLLNLLIVYVVVTFVLRRFPYTRPWGESMRGFLVDTVQMLGLSAANALPGFFTVALILVLARLFTRLVATYFNAVESGRIDAPPWLHPETAQPTRRLLTAGTWLFAIVVAYPYLPGSQTDAFKGVSVFVGLMFTLGSAGIVQHVMSGFMITYSRALRVGDFVKIGEVEGTVTHIGILSTKVRTPRREEITIPNAVVTAQTTIDYSRFAQSDGVMTPTSVTIGYDAPWRQVEALLLAAAERTSGIRREPRPVVMQAALEDFYVKYVLLVSLEQQERKAPVLTLLHANIQDEFNEHGVQIMSPNYEADPAAPKIVAKKDWFAAPATAPTGEASRSLQRVER
jgi:small-conductance mechanosensitive channel